MVLSRSQLQIRMVSWSIPISFTPKTKCNLKEEEISMTDLLYQRDSYLQAFDATITAVNEAERGVALDQSAFYPGGGGQPHDTGILRLGGLAFPVTKVRKGPEGVWHTLGGEAPLPVIGQ